MPAQCHQMSFCRLRFRHGRRRASWLLVLVLAVLAVFVFVDSFSAGKALSILRHDDTIQSKYAGNITLPFLRRAEKLFRHMTVFEHVQKFKDWEGPLLRWNRYELRRLKKPPFITIKKIPPRLVSSFSVEAAAEGFLDDFRGYPFSTTNTGSVALGIARPVDGKLSATVSIPPQSLDSGAFHAERKMTRIKYQQKIPGIGNIVADLCNDGEWNFGLQREVESLGSFQVHLDSELDWSVDLEKTYSFQRGFSPSISYGATQDGARGRLTLEGKLDKTLSGAYSVSNQPGEYSFADLQHDGKLVVSSTSGLHAIEFLGSGNHNQKRTWGSLKYSVTKTPKLFQMAVDNDQYHLHAGTSGVALNVSVQRKPGEGGLRPIDVSLKVSKVIARARLIDGKPLVRISVGT